MILPHRTRSKPAIFIVLCIIAIAIAAGVWWWIDISKNHQPGSVDRPTTDKVTAPNAQPDSAKLDKYDVAIGYIAIGDNGVSGEKIGCNDSIVPVAANITTTEPLHGAFTLLLTNKSQFYSQSGLYNALWQSNLTVVSAVLRDGVATVKLSGKLTLSGECDNPRVKAQLESTASQMVGVNSVVITINGLSLDQALSLK